MSILATKSLSLTLGVPLFAGLSFTLEAGDRVGLVAANGRGKSSLLRCLAGVLEATSGDITRARGTVVGLVEQDAAPALLALSLREAVAGALPADEAEAESWRVDVILDDLEVPEDLRDQTLGALSGGWQRAALLARVAILAPDVYLLDEPTNHLDLSRIGRLQRWLAALPRDVASIVAFLLSSHAEMIHGAGRGQVRGVSGELRPAQSPRRRRTTELRKPGCVSLEKVLDSCGHRLKSKHCLAGV